MYTSNLIRCALAQTSGALAPGGTKAAMTAPQGGHALGVAGGEAAEALKKLGLRFEYFRFVGLQAWVLDRGCSK